MQLPSGPPSWLGALDALHRAKAKVIEESCRTGAPVIIWRNEKVYHQPPEEAKREFEQSLKNAPGSSVPLNASEK